MGKKIPDAVLDIPLNDIKNNADIMHICDGEPDDYADISSHSKGSVAMDSGDYTIGDGDISGRKITVSAQTVTPNADGSIDHLVFVDESESAIKAIDTIATKSVTNGVAETVAAFDLWEIGDPS